MLKKLDRSLGTEILVSKKDAARLADVVKENEFTLSAQTADIRGGFIVKNGDIEYGKRTNLPFRRSQRALHGK